MKTDDKIAELKTVMPTLHNAIDRAQAGENDVVTFPPTGEAIHVEFLPARLGVVLSIPSRPRFYKESWRATDRMKRRDLDPGRLG